MLSEKAGNIDFIPNKSHTKDVHYAMSNSFAFGGNNASIIFSDNEHDIPDNSKNEKIYITGISKLTGTRTDEHSLNCNLTSEDYDKHGIKVAFYRKLDRFSQLQLLSGMDALADADIKIDKDNEYKTGIVIGTADGPMTEIVDFQKKAITRGTEKGSAFSFPNTVYNAAGGYLSIFSGIKGYNATVANGNQAGLQSICYAADILADGNESVMLAAGTDENTKTNLELYTKAELLEKPLGEGSVTLVLETEEHALARGAKIYAEIRGCGNTDDAYHVTAPHPEGRGAIACMKQAIAEAGINPSDIGYINAHGTATNKGDTVETSSIKKVFGNTLPYVSSTKGATGHMMGAGGITETITCVKAIETGTVPPTINLNEVDPECAGIDFVANTAKKAEINFAMSNAFGFGGQNSSIIVGKYGK